jgi:hypothetical protein
MLAYHSQMDLQQDDMRAEFESWGADSWSVVTDDWHDKQGNGGVHCALGPQSARQKVVSDPGWDVPKGDYRPGFMQHYEGGEVSELTYVPGAGADGFEPIVLLRDYHGIVPSNLELTEQFRLYHNLYWDAHTCQYMQPHDDGTSSVAVKVADRRIEVRTKLLRQYQAARQLDLLFFVDSVRIGTRNDDLPEDADWSTEFLRATRHSGSLDKNRPFTRYLGSRLLPPPSIEKSGIWPYEAEDDYYPDFIVDTDEDGDEVRYTCNPDALANYFGANPEAPHYLTPVHFRREVLQKYYDKPELYTVSDGHLSCAALWSVRMDNSAKEAVIVFLGDLGRDLPRQERDYWRSFNIAPDSPMSETLVRRAFLGQWADPTAGDLQVRSKYVSLSESWSARYGWDLFRKPEEADAGLLQRLRLPLDESQAEFEASIRIMTQLCVDAINEAEIQSLLPDRRDNEKGIAKLKRWLEQEGYPHVDRDIQFLRNLQEARSKVTAHRKGSDYEKTLTKIFGDLRGATAVKMFFESALEMLTGLTEWVATENTKS